MGARPCEEDRTTSRLLTRLRRGPLKGETEVPADRTKSRWPMPDEKPEQVRLPRRLPIAGRIVFACNVALVLFAILLMTGVFVRFLIYLDALPAPH
jgi:hypothetical protein